MDIDVSKYGRVTRTGAIELVANELDHKLMLVSEGAIGAAEFIDSVADLVTIIRNVPQEVTFD